MSKNTVIWDKVSKTDPGDTAAYKGPGGFMGTAITFASVIQKATEVFGPVGIGWGYEIMEERFDEGAPITEYVEELGRQVEIAKFSTHTIRLKLWVIIDGERAEVEHYGHTPYIYKNKYGIQSDGESSKKSLTDAIKKCFSMFGFNADIYLGLYDDHHYVESVKNEMDLEKAENITEKMIEQEREYVDWKDKNIKLIESSVSLNELQALFVSATRKAKRKEDAAFLKTLTKAKDKRKEELTDETA